MKQQETIYDQLTEPESVFEMEPDVRENRIIEKNYHYDDKEDGDVRFYLKDGEVVGHGYKILPTTDYDTVVQVVQNPDKDSGKIIVTKGKQTNTFLFPRNKLRLVARVGWDNKPEFHWSFRYVNNTVRFVEMCVPNKDEKTRNSQASHNLHIAGFKHLDQLDIDKIQSYFPSLRGNQLYMKKKHWAISKFTHKLTGRFPPKFIEMLQQTNWVLPQFEFHHILPLAYQGGNNIKNLMLVESNLHQIIHELTTTPVENTILFGQESPFALQNIVRNVIRMPLLPNVIVNVKDLCGFFNAETVKKRYDKKVKKESRTSSEMLKNICLNEAYTPRQLKWHTFLNKLPFFKFKQINTPTPLTINEPPFTNCRFDIQNLERQQRLEKQLTDKTTEMNGAMVRFLQSVFFLLGKEHIEKVIDLIQQDRIRRSVLTKKDKNFHIRETLDNVYAIAVKIKNDTQKIPVQAQIKNLNSFLKNNNCNQFLIAGKKVPNEETICYDLNLAIGAADKIIQNFSNLLYSAYRKDLTYIYNHRERLSNAIDMFQRCSFDPLTNKRLAAFRIILNYIIPPDKLEITPQHSFYQLYDISNVLSVGIPDISSNKPTPKQPVAVQTSHHKTAEHQNDQHIR